MREKFSMQKLEEAMEKLINDAANLATTKIRHCMYEQLEQLSIRFPKKWFSFNGKMVTVHDRDEDLQTLIQ